MSSVNKCLLIGRLGRDPDTRYTQSGGAVANFTLATSERWKDKATGEKTEKTEWHRCVAFGPQAERIAEWCSKGTLLFVEGRIETRQWEDDSGNKRYTTEIVIRDFQKLSTRGESQQSEAQEEQPAARAASQPALVGDLDDDIPF